MKKSHVFIGVIGIVSLCIIGSIYYGRTHEAVESHELNINEEKATLKTHKITRQESLINTYEEALSHIGETTDKAEIADIENSVNTYAQLLNHRSLILNDLLTVNSISDISYFDVSNAVAHIPSKTILDALDKELDNLYPDDPKTRMIMTLHEIIYRRGEPRWAATYSLSMLVDFYSSAGIEEKRWWVMNEQLRLPMPPDSASTLEKATYASIQLTLSQMLEGDRRIEQIENIKRMAQEETITFPPQPLDMLEYAKAAELIKLGRVEEGKELLYTIYDLLEKNQMHPSLRSGHFRHGPERTFNDIIRMHNMNIDRYKETLQKQEELLFNN